MEKRKQSLSSLKLCRFCLSQGVPLTSLYDRNRPKNSVNLPLKILSCIAVEIFPSDKMPQYICDRCLFFMNTFYEYKQLCRQGDEDILQYIHNGQPLKNVCWPPSLLKIFRSSNETATVKTIVDGDTTVEVTTQDGSESDDDEEADNVYNVKIGDGLNEATKACIKVVTSKPNEENEDEGTPQKDSEMEMDFEGGTLAVTEESCWPCDECDCNYPLQQLLILHKNQKHRSRTVECDQCDAKFFSRYDLSVHLLRHSEEMPFQCVACGKKYKRLILLKRHEKLHHADLPQLKCANCPATFLSHEELETHKKKHVIRSRPHACSICDKKFYEKTTLQRHIDAIHSKALNYSCEYCPQRFSSVSKLTKHVRTHAGERPYPCKFCSKSFLKSHHYTRHLRVKHREENMGASPGEYRCEQCEDSFVTQDELIYHSAIHATQNLICPLCQEKFENVDAVTAHIKSHVTGTEFMCDYCELVFTTKEKLDSHVIVAHEDEIQSEMPQDETSMDMDADDDEDSAINVKDKGDHMVIEVKKADNYLIPSQDGESDEKPDIVHSEESETDPLYSELPVMDPMAIVTKISPKTPEKVAPIVAAPITTPASVSKISEKTASILRRAEEIKRKTQSTLESNQDQKEKCAIKPEVVNRANDKSLRLLEKELQELKRTNSRNVKIPIKTVETPRNRRVQMHASTPKTRVAEEKELVASSKPVIEKKIPDRRLLTKENKEPKDSKEVKNSIKDEKELKETDTKEIKEKNTPKTQSAVKNGANDKNASEEGIRRSTRPSKIKDYAKMIRDRSQDSIDEDSDEDDEEYRESDKSLESRSKSRKSISKPPPKSTPPSTPVDTTPTPTRKRGRPRKFPPKVPVKIKKEDDEDKTEENSETADKPASEEKTTTDAVDSLDDSNPPKEVKPEIEAKRNTTPGNATVASPAKPVEQTVSPPSNVLVSPTGQTLKKVPIKALPPGVKPLPLPVNARPMATGELCEMQIGKKVVKVQKIVMTKAEVEAMAKKGLVEMKGGTMVLKQGIKLPTADNLSLKSNLVADKDNEKESLNKDAETS